MQRHVRFIADHPTVMSRRDVEQITGFHFDNPAIVHSGGRAARNHHADVFYGAVLQSLSRTHVNRPFPAGFVTGSPDGHPADMHKFELALLKCADFVRIFKALEYDFVHVIATPQLSRAKRRICNIAPTTRIMDAWKNKSRDFCRGLRASNFAIAQTSVVRRHRRRVRRGHRVRHHDDDAARRHRRVGHLARHGLHRDHRHAPGDRQQLAAQARRG